MIVDLSHPITRDGFVYPGFPAPEVAQFRSHAMKGTPYGPTTSFAMTRVNAVTNIGTYLDSPYHRHERMPDFTGVPIERLVNLRGVVVDARRHVAAAMGAGGPPIKGVAARELPASLFPVHRLMDHAVLILTGWSERWNTQRYTEPGPFLGREAADVLAAAEPALVGIDAMNIDDREDPERPAHTVLLGAGIVVCEHMTNLDQLVGKAFRFFAAPPAWQGVASFPVRAFALLE